MAGRQTVYLVVDRNYGDKLLALPVDSPVWVVGSGGNREVASRMRATRQSKSHFENVTTFDDPPGLTAEGVFLEILGTVDEHHGLSSMNPPYSELIGIGVGSTESIQAELFQLGFSVIQSDAISLKAVRR